MRLSRALGRPLRIVLGSGGSVPRGWIGTDIDSLNLAREDDWAALLPPNSVSALLAEHVWEHLDPSDAATGAALCHRYLRPGGYLRLAVPDGNHPDPEYLEHVRVGGSGPGAADHRVLYTAASLTALLEQAGFDVMLLECFDPAGTFHFREWSPADGLIRRSRRHDPRNADGTLRYTSLIVDATKR